MCTALDGVLQRVISVIKTSVLYLRRHNKKPIFAKNSDIPTRETKEREKTCRETLGKFFYDLAKTCFAAIVVGNLISFFTEEEKGVFPLFIIGILTTIVLARVGYLILKNGKRWKD